MRKIMMGLLVGVAFASSAFAGDAGMTRVSLQVAGAEGVRESYGLHARDGQSTPLQSVSTHSYVKGCRITEEGEVRLEAGTYQTGLTAEVNVKPSTVDGVKVVELFVGSAQLVKRQERRTDDGCHVELVELESASTRNQIALKRGESKEIAYGPGSADRVTVGIY
jgi:hypothetical protein